MAWYCCSDLIYTSMRTSTKFGTFVILVTIILLSHLTNNNYNNTVFSRSGINQMWILKNSKELLDQLKSRSILKINAIKTFDFSTLYTTIPHYKTTIEEHHQTSVFLQKWFMPLQVCGIGYTNAKNTDAKDIIHMLEFLIDNIFVDFGEHFFPTVHRIPMIAC